MAGILISGYIQDFIVGHIRCPGNGRFRSFLQKVSIDLIINFVLPLYADQLAFGDRKFLK